MMGRSRGKSVRGVVVLLLTMGLSAALWATTSLGGAVGGNKGDIKLHDITDATTDKSDNPKPCDPVLVSFDFAVGEQYTYEFVTQPGGTLVIGPTTVTVSSDPQQEPSSGSFNLPDGQYKLRWDAGSSISGGSKQKVFKIDCEDPPPPPETDPGSFAVTKTVSGPGAPADFAFDVSIVCSDGFLTDVVLTDEEPTATIDNLEAGTTCTVDEPDSQGATTSYSPGQTSDPVPENGTASVTINNAFAEVGGIETEPAPATAVNLTPSFTG